MKRGKTEGERKSEGEREREKNVWSEKFLLFRVLTVWNVRGEINAVS